MMWNYVELDNFKVEVIVELCGIMLNNIPLYNLCSQGLASSLEVKNFIDSELGVCCTPAGRIQCPGAQSRIFGSEIRA